MFDIRVEGIYDWRTFHFLEKMGVKHFHFDFNPRSLSFLPQHEFFEILEKTSLAGKKIVLGYSGESKLAIEKMYQDLISLYSKNQIQESVLFEFQIDDEFEKFESLEAPLSVRVNETSQLKKLKDLQGLHALVLDQFQLERLELQSRLGGYIQSLNQVATSTRFINYALRISNENEIMVSLFDLYPARIISFPIDSSLEVCYRNTDLKKLEIRLKHIRQSLENLELY